MGCIVSLIFVAWLNIGAVVTGANTSTAIVLPLRWDKCPLPPTPNMSMDAPTTKVMAMMAAFMTDMTEAPPIPPIVIEKYVS